MEKEKIYRKQMLLGLIRLQYFFGLLFFLVKLLKKKEKKTKKKTEKSYGKSPHNAGHI